MGPIPHTLSDHLCLDFVNSRLTDHLGGGAVMDRVDAAEWRAWFVERWHLGPIFARPSLEQLKAARETVRNVLQDWAGGKVPRRSHLKALDAWLAAAAVRRRLDGKVEPVRRDWDWVIAEVVASATELMAEAEPVRLKACANPGCTWMFWDESKNVSRRWCDPRTCGNLVTVREFRRRKREDQLRAR